MILTRKPGESITINGNIVIKVLGPSRSGETRIGIEAPRDVGVVRTEIINRERTEP